jgi:hypothetical protein
LYHKINQIYILNKSIPLLMGDMEGPCSELPMILVTVIRTGLVVQMCANESYLKRHEKNVEGVLLVLESYTALPNGRGICFILLLSHLKG